MRTPAGVLLPLAGVTVLAMATTGYGFGVVGPGRTIAIPLMTLAFSLVVGLIGVLDRPIGGFVVSSGPTILAAPRAVSERAPGRKRRGAWPFRFSPDLWANGCAGNTPFASAVGVALRAFTVPRKLQRRRGMRISPKIALSAFAVTVVAGLSACSHYDVREAYGCVPGTPNVTETCNYPTYAGNVQIDGMPRPFLHYRDTLDGREFYVDGKWRKADPGTPFGKG